MSKETTSVVGVAVKSLPVTDRILEIKSAFAARYKQEPEYYVRVPGRVNLIGEHIDYSGYGVCPMALEQDIVLAVATHDDGILQLANFDKSFSQFESPIKELQIIRNEGPPEWYQYFLCGVKGILEILPKETSLKGFRVMVSGTIPQSAGLSSSSALVSAASLAFAHAHKISLSKEKIASICAECERYIGTQGGGMDQAIAFLATKGCAKLINFDPLRSEDVALPPGAVFVIAHSLTRLNKAATADFNCRVIECRLAAQVLAKKCGLDWMKIRKLGELQAALNLDLNSMEQLVIKHLHQHSYTIDEVIMLLETTNEQLREVSLTENTTHLRNFKLYQRALHVFQEAHRVDRFHQVCINSSGEGCLEELGKLMSASHASLKDLYECSHPQLDRLVELSVDIALGARLTGAGWGGCVVALLTPENVDKYITMIRNNFYKKLGEDGNMESIMFATEPQAGACIYIDN